ncbi:nickel insertion protein, partial [Staphylococcus epidermidis]|uniref:nickel insertion protein n=1 Tax=Staphylococcus epidermidis TaxID=1282 RepID=UPI0011A7DF20
PFPSPTIQHIPYPPPTNHFHFPNILTLIQFQSQFHQQDTLQLIHSQIDHITPQPLPYFINNPLDQPPLHPYYTPIFIKKTPPSTHLTLISKLHHNT